MGLREVLLGGVDNLDDALATIKWDYQISQIEQQDEKLMIVTEKDRSQGRFDIVVDADGLWSKVRPLLTNTMPVYTGHTILEAHSPPI